MKPNLNLLLAQKLRSSRGFVLPSAKEQEQAQALIDKGETAEAALDLVKKTEVKSTINPK